MNAPPSHPPGPPDIHSESFLHSLMRRQLRLSIACAATFLAALLGLPLLNYYFPEVMSVRVFGFTLTWFVLGVLFFPFVWFVSAFFIRRSIALEEAEVAETKLQVPSSKLQIGSEPETPMGGSGTAVVALLGVGAWSFLGTWNLELGTWCLGGIWILVLGVLPLGI